MEKNYITLFFLTSLYILTYFAAPYFWPADFISSSFGQICSLLPLLPLCRDEIRRWLKG